MKEEEIDNPLVQPCICSGSMKYIHLNCLKKWLNTSVIIKMESTLYVVIVNYITYIYIKRLNVNCAKLNFQILLSIKE